MRWLVELEPKRKRNKPATKIDMGLLQADVVNFPNSFQYERAQRFGVSKSGIGLALLRLKVSYKKTWNHPKADDAKRVLFQEKVTIYREQNRSIVYLDESGFVHSMSHTHGYSLLRVLDVMANVHGESEDESMLLAHCLIID